MVRSGSQWRLLAKEYGNWNVVYQRFASKADQGVWYKMLYYATQRARSGIYHGGFHHFTRSCLCQWCAQKKHGTQQEQALGRSRGGFSTKIHGVCDALGNPLGLILTGGQVADCLQAFPLLQGRHFQAKLADKGYDTDSIIAYVESVAAKAIIPPKSNRIVQRD